MYLALLVGLRKTVLSESKTQLLNFLSMQICSSRIIFNGLLVSIRKFAIFDLKKKKKKKNIFVFVFNKLIDVATKRLKYIKITSENL